MLCRLLNYLSYPHFKGKNLSKPNSNLMISNMFFKFVFSSLAQQQDSKTKLKSPNFKLFELNGYSVNY